MTATKWTEIELKVAQTIADDEGQTLETVLECWELFRQQPTDVQKLWLKEQDDFDEGEMEHLN